MKKTWLVTGALVGVLALTTMGGVALAQTGGEGTPTPAPSATAEGKDFAARLAEKLGISEDAVKDAIAEVRRDVQDEHVAKRLDRLVEAGKLTQEQADEYEAWWKARPEGPLPLLGQHHGPIAKRFIAKHFRQGDGDGDGDRKARAFIRSGDQLPPAIIPPLAKLGAIPEEKVEGLLDRMVEAGRLTQEQADEYLAWWKSR